MLALVSILVCAMSAGGQVIRRPATVREPPWWASFIVAYSSSHTISDGSTHSDWEFGSTTPYGVALEKSLQPGTSIGASASFAQAPLVYRSTGGIGPLNCPTSCEATANVTQLVAVLRSESRNLLTLRFAREFGLGMIAYSNFRDQAAGAKLPPSNPDLDFLFTFGTDLGFNFTQTSSIEIGFGTGFSVHHRTGLAANADALHPLFGVRLGARFGLGG